MYMKKTGKRFCSLLFTAIFVLQLSLVPMITGVAETNDSVNILGEHSSTINDLVSTGEEGFLNQGAIANEGSTNEEKSSPKDNNIDGEKDSSIDNNIDGEKNSSIDNNIDGEKGSSLDNNTGAEKGSSLDNNTGAERDSSIDNNTGAEKGSSIDNNIDGVGINSPDPLADISVTYHANGGEGHLPVDASAPYAQGSTIIVLNEGNLTKEGYAFIGWATSEDGEGPLYQQFDEFITDGTAVHFYAQWQETNDLVLFSNETPTIADTFAPPIAQKVATEFRVTTSDPLPANLMTMRKLSLSNEPELIGSFKGIELLTGLTSISLYDCTIAPAAFTTFKLQNLTAPVALSIRATKHPLDLTNWDTQGVTAPISNLNLSGALLNYPSFNAAMANLNLTGEVNLSDTGLTSFNDLSTSSFANVTALTLAQNYDLADIQNLNTANLSALQTLTLTSSSISSFAGWDVSGLTSLKTLTVGNAKVTNATLATLQPLMDLPSMVKIDFSNSALLNKAKSFNGISDFSSLEPYSTQYPNVTIDVKQQEITIDALRNATTHIVEVKNPVVWVDSTSSAFTISSISDNGSSSTEGADLTLAWNISTPTSGTRTFHFSKSMSISLNAIHQLSGRVTVKYSTEYTVTYNPNTTDPYTGNLPVDDNTYQPNVTVSVSTGTLQREGHTFIGWATTTSAEEKITEFTINDNTTLYAVWKIIPYTIEYITNGGTAVATQTVNYNTTFTEPADPKRPNYTFKGWYTEAALTNAYSFDTPATKNITLYAKWEEDKKYPVTYNGNGADSGSVPTDATQYSENITVTVRPNEGALGLTGHTFKGWALTDNATKGIANFVITGPTTLYAVWEMNQFTINYITNGGSAVGPETVKYNSLFTKPTDPTKANHIFKGWYTEAAFTNAYTFNTPATQNITLYAQWEEDEKYTLTYNGNGAQGAPPADANAYYANSEATVLPAGNLTYTNHSFTGWNTQADGKGKHYAPGEKLVVTANTVLYAQWQLNIREYTLTYYPNGGRGIAPTDPYSYAFGQVATILNQGNLYRSGYTFVGWNTQPNGKGAAYGPGTLLTVTDDHFLYAQWKNNETGVIEIPKTGDTSNTILWISLLAMALLALITLVTIKNKKAKKN